MFFFKFANYEAFKGVFLVILEPFSCFPGVFSRFAQNLSQNRIKAFRRCFSVVFLFPFLFFSFLSSFLHSVFSVCVFLSWLSVYEEWGEEYLWEIRQRGGGAAPSRPCCGGCAPYSSNSSRSLYVYIAAPIDITQAKAVLKESQQNPCITNPRVNDTPHTTDNKAQRTKDVCLL